ncbi:MAG TPA: flagellar FliJ family protein [Pirellulales bacterium]|jgi:flagellar export protein FliJ|nr:flagellar FliJ family protein [Pirellulales bacterium]
MARFQFRLKALLAVREATRDERRVELAEAQSESRTLNERRAGVERELAKQQDLFRSGTSPGRIDVDRLKTEHCYDLVLRRELRVLSEQEQTLTAEIERRREALVAADREVRILEELRERQHEQFRQQQMVRETKHLDEVAALVTRNDEP